MSDSRVRAAWTGCPGFPTNLCGPPRRDGGRGWDVPVGPCPRSCRVAGFSFWLGRQSADPMMQVRQPANAVPSATIAVPEPRLASPEEVKLAPQPQVAPAAEPSGARRSRPEVRIVPAPGGSADPKVAPEPRSAAEPVATPEKPVAAAASSPPKVAARVPLLQAWPPRVVAGAAGRLVQVGAFGSRRQAKRGWWHMVARLSGAEAPSGGGTRTRNSRGPHLLSVPDRHDVAGAFGSPVPAHAADRPQLRGRRPAVEVQGRAVTDHRRPMTKASCPGLQAVEDEEEPRGISRVARCSPRSPSCCLRR